MFMMCISSISKFLLFLLIATTTTTTTTTAVSVPTPETSTPTTRHVSLLLPRRNQTFYLPKTSCSSLCTSIRGGGGSERSTVVSSPSSAVEPETQTQRHIQNNNNNNPQIEAILIPRSLSPVRLLRVMLLTILLHFFFQCISTMGQPYRQALKELGFVLVNNHDKVSPMIQLMAQYTASGSDGQIELPPMHLPSFTALMGVIGIMALLILSILLPIWNTRLEVLVNYRVLMHSAELNKGEKKKNEEEELQVLLLDQYRYDTLHGMPVAALVRVFSGNGNAMSTSASTEGTTTGSSTFIILPLYPVHSSTSTSASTSTTIEERTQQQQEQLHGHPQSWYIEHQHQRIYVNPHTLESIYGGPTFYQSIPIYRLLNPTATTTTATNIAQERYGPYNHITLTHPTIGSTLRQRFTSSPLVMIQLASSLLYALEDEAQHAVMNLISKLLWYYINARRVVVQSKQLARDIEMQEDSLGNMVVKVLRFQEQKKISSTVRESKTKKKKNRDVKKSRVTSKWVDVPIKDVLPGDVFCIPIPHRRRVKEDKGPLSNVPSTANTAIPIDALLLEGTVVCNEAVLTGESVPQCKVPLLSSDIDANCTDTLDMFGRHRSSVLFSGTTLVHASNDGVSTVDAVGSAGLEEHDLAGRTKYQPTPQGYVRCLALRTGSYSSRGELIRALHENPTALGSDPIMERDGLRSIGVLSLFAIATCASLLLDMGRLDLIPSSINAPQVGSVTKESCNARANRKPASAFRKIIMCTRIAMASIPTDLPLAISGVVSACAEHLKAMDDVVCSTPMSLLEASRINMVVFDKTGTLTADTHRMTDVVQYDDLPSSIGPQSMIEAVLSGCHSLVGLQRDSVEPGGRIVSTVDIVGDPLDLAALRYTGWVFEDQEHMAYSPLTAAGPSIETERCNEKDIPPAIPSRPVKLWRLNSFPFDPNRRMSSAVLLVLHENGTFRLWKAVKGATDVMKHYFRGRDPTDLSSFHDWYDRQCQLLGNEGKRIVATGCEDVTSQYQQFLFPDGLPIQFKGQSDQVIVPHKTIEKTRKLAREHIQRKDVEDTMSTSLIFSGFACFSASIRGSSARVVQDLKNAGMEVCMLTGDGIDAAISVAVNTGVISRRQARKGLAVLDVVYSQDNMQDTLCWRIVKPLSSKKEVQTKDSSKRTWFSKKSAMEAIHRGRDAIIATGEAIDVLLSECESSEASVSQKRAHLYMRNNLNEVAVVACASPQTKQRMIQALKGHCNRSVLMCGECDNNISV